MRIAYVVTDLGLGGTQRWVVLTSTELARRGHSVRVFAERGPSERLDELAAAGVDVLLLDAPFSPAVCRRAIEGYQPQIVHLHVWERQREWVECLYPERRWALVVSHHWAPRRPTEAKLTRWLKLLRYRLTNRRWCWLLRNAVDAQLGCCESSAAYYRALSARGRSWVLALPNAIPLPAQPTSQEVLAAEPRFLQVGSLCYRKRPDLALEAFASLEGRYPGSRLVFVGDGPLAPELIARAAEMGVRDVHFVGAVLNPTAYFQASNVLLLPSLCEGLPYAILEGAAHGLAVVASNVGGVPEVVKHGKTGLLVQPGSRRELQLAMEVFARDVSLRITLGRNARQLVYSAYRFTEQVDLLVDIYTRLCKYRSPGGYV